MIVAVRGIRPQKVGAPWRASSIWAVISPKVASTRLRHSAMIFRRIGGLVLRCCLVAGTRTAVPLAAWAGGERLAVESFVSE